MSFRYAKIYLRDLKRKVKTLLQIEDGNQRSNSQKGSTQTPITPTIIIRKPSDAYDIATPGGSDRNTYFSDRFTNEPVAENPTDLIENALNRYFQLVTMNNSYDLSKLIDVSL